MNWNGINVNWKWILNEEKINENQLKSFKVRFKVKMNQSESKMNSNENELNIHHK